MTRKIEALLAEYGESHQNETNKLVHWVCVPVIVWTILALLWAIPSPALFDGIPYLNWSTLVTLLALVYYLFLSPMIAFGIFVFAAICIFVIHMVIFYVSMPLWIVAIIAFVLAWIGQFWGHKVEGKKPSFFKDVQFLLIGPAWLLSFLYKRLGIPY